MAETTCWQAIVACHGWLVIIRPLCSRFTYKTHHLATCSLPPPLTTTTTTHVWHQEGRSVWLWCFIISSNIMGSSKKQWSSFPLTACNEFLLEAVRYWCGVRLHTRMSCDQIQTVSRLDVQIFTIGISDDSTWYMLIGIESTDIQVWSFQEQDVGSLCGSIL